MITGVVSSLLACAPPSAPKPVAIDSRTNEPVQVITKSHKKSQYRHIVYPTAGLADAVRVTNEPDKVVMEYKKANPTLWQDMAAQFSLPGETEDVPEVKRQIDWFVSHPKYLEKATSQAKPYLYYICEQVKARGLPIELALMPMVESSYNPFAVNSSSGATGLWQMMPGTASGFGLHVDWWYDGRRDISTSTNAALDYLAYLGSFFNGDWLLAMAAYDSGEGTVQQSIERNATHGRDTTYWGLHLPHETQGYIPKVLALATILKNPQNYNVDLPDIPDAPYLTSIDLSSQMNLHKAAKMAGMTLAELSSLNPGYNRWATAPKGSYKLLLPVDRAAQFQTSMTAPSDATQAPASNLTWDHIAAKSSDSLQSIAQNYNTTPELLMKANKLSSEHVKAGQSLLVPSNASADNSTADNADIDEDVGEKITTLADSNVINHMITQGETLKSIAAKYHVTLRQIEFWNDVTEADINPGEELVIWPPKYKVSSLKKVVKIYKVKHGDTLYSVAQRFHVTTSMIKKRNHLGHKQIRSGEILHIPVIMHAESIAPVSQHIKSTHHAKKSHILSKKTHAKQKTKHVKKVSVKNKHHSASKKSMKTKHKSKTTRHKKHYS